MKNASEHSAGWVLACAASLLVATSVQKHAQQPANGVARPAAVSAQRVLLDRYCVNLPQYDGSDSRIDARQDESRADQ
jgi:hypothetical protein